MISLNIPGFKQLELSALVCDYNGTLAVDGQLLPGVADGIVRNSLMRFTSYQIRISSLSGEILTPRISSLYHQRIDS
jgi:hypothetical protein